MAVVTDRGRSEAVMSGVHAEAACVHGSPGKLSCNPECKVLLCQKETQDFPQTGPTGVSLLGDGHLLEASCCPSLQAELEVVFTCEDP